MDDWYAWLMVFRQREAEALARRRRPRTSPRAVKTLRAQTPAPLRFLVGSALIRLGEALVGLPPAPGACSDG